MCPTCAHERHEGHQYVSRGVCDGCPPCNRFRHAYRRAEDMRDLAHELLDELDHEWLIRQTAAVRADHEARR